LAFSDAACAQFATVKPIFADMALIPLALDKFWASVLAFSATVFPLIAEISVKVAALIPAFVSIKASPVATSKA
jgi:hypothetical protein